jgi:hypothetical protein
VCFACRALFFGLSVSFVVTCMTVSNGHTVFVVGRTMLFPSAALGAVPLVFVPCFWWFTTLMCRCDTLFFKKF